MNKENAIAAINKYGKIGSIISKVLLVILGISVFATIIGSIVLLAMPEDFIKLSMNNQATCTMDFNVVDKLAGTDTSETAINQAVQAFNSGNVKGGLNLGAVRFVFDRAEIVDGKLVATANGSGDDISLRSISGGVMVAAVAVILAFVSVLFASKLCKAFQTCETPFSEDVITAMKRFAISLVPWALFSSVPESFMNSILGNSLKISISLDMNVLFTVAIIWMLTIVFQYGAQLQQESDETL